MHAFPRWFEISMAILLSPITWWILLALVVFGIYSLVRWIKKRRKKTELPIPVVVLPPESRSGGNAG